MRHFRGDRPCQAGNELLDDVWLMLHVCEARDIGTCNARLIDDPLVIDSVLVEGGGFAEFLEQRGELLPADERALLRI
ncbi:hypothetical protein MPHO_22160 [Mycolicibacterium phocaicum]|nr:hypothetical protein MPHO_22160 [Mycolicibacterium phocaicum]